MDFRQYDNALGRFHNMDRLTELAPGITPYRFGFNNPNYWSDPTGLFETAIAANSYMKENGLSGTVYKAGDGLYHLVTSAFDYVMTSNGDLVISVVDVGVEITVNGGGSSKPINSGGLYGGSTFFGANGFLGGNNSTDLSYVGNASTIGSFVTNAISSRAAENANYVYKYGTKTASAVELTAQNAKQMGNLAKVTGSISTKIGVAGILITVGDDWRNDNLGAGTVAKTAIGVLSLAFPGFGLVYGYVDVMTLATTGTSLTTHIGNTVDNAFK